MRISQSSGPPPEEEDAGNLARKLAKAQPREREALIRDIEEGDNEAHKLALKTALEKLRRN